MVNWSRDSITDGTLEPTLVSEAAQLTPSGKDAGGTEINLSPFKLAFSAVVDITFLIVCINLQTANLPKYHCIVSTQHK